MTLPFLAPASDAYDAIVATEDAGPSDHYAARDLFFPDRATFFLTGMVAADTEPMCAVAAVSIEPSSDVVRISR